MSGDTTPNKDAVWRRYLRPHEKAEIKGLDAIIQRLTSARQEALERRRQLMQMADRRARRANGRQEHAA